MAITNATNPPRGPVMSRWLGGKLIFYPADVPGDCFFVNSQAANASDSNGGLTWDEPLATIDAGVDLTTASRGDSVIVHPSHTEDLAADSAIDIDKVGVQVFGLRFGRLMPTLNVTAAAGDCKLAADGTSIHNLRFTGGVDTTTGCIEVTASDFGIHGCEYRDVTGEATDVIMVTDGSDRGIIEDWRHIGAATDGANTSIAIDGADDLILRNINIWGDFALAPIEFRTNASARAWMRDLWLYNEDDTAGADNVQCILDTVTGSTGMIGPNIYLFVNKNAANITGAITGATFVIMGDVEVANLVGEQSMAIDWTDATDA